MGRTKQTPRGSSSHWSAGMTAATFTSMGRGKAGPEEQFRDAPGEDTEDSIELPLVLEDAEQPKEGKPGTSKSKGKQLGDQVAQATEGAEAPPQETPPNPNPTEPHTDPASIDPQPGTSKAPTQAPTKDPTQAPTEDPTQTATKNPDEDKPPALTKYVMEYKAAGKAWLESVVKDQEEAYIKLFDKLMELGNPYIDNFDQADREQVFKCIRDKTGRFLNDDDFVTYIETEEEKEKPKYVFTRDAKLALMDYYDAVHMLYEAQQNFARSTQVLEEKIEDKSIFLDIIKQVQLPSAKVQVRTVEEMEKIEGKTYRELMLMCHLPNFKRINPNAKEQTRTMAAYIYFILYEQITSTRASQTGCTTNFRCQMTPFKRLVPGKKQPGGPGRSSEVRGGSSRSLEEVAEMEGATPTKRTRKASKSAAATTTTPKGRGLKGWGKKS